MALDSSARAAHDSMKRHIREALQRERAAKRHKAAAFHEAGHAVVGSSVSFWIGDVRIARDGHTTHGKADSAARLPEKQCPIELVLGGLAGFAAERRVDREAHPRDGSHTDFNEAARILGYRPFDQYDHARDAHIQQLLATCDQILDERWAIVEEVAARLMELAAVPAADVARIIGRGLVALGIAPDGFQILRNNEGRVILIKPTQQEGEIIQGTGDLLDTKYVVDYATSESEGV